MLSAGSGAAARADAGVGGGVAGVDLAADGARVRGWCRSWRGAGAALVVLCAIVLVPGMVSIPPVDRDESRFAQASRQMYESGDYVVPRIQDRPRLNKPPLIYWLQCGSIAVFGDSQGRYANANIWVFRVPSAVCAMVTVLLTWRLGLRLFDARAAALGAAMLAVCPMLVWDAHQARADQLLLMTTTAAMVALWRVWSATSAARAASSSNGRVVGARGLAWAIGFWVAIGAGVLAKGPITPLVAGLTVVALGVTTRRWAWVWGGLRPMLGVVIVAAMVGPWVYAVGERVGWSAYLTEIYEETLGRSKAPKEGHWGPPGYHLVLLCALFWPGVLLTGAAVQRAFGLALPTRSGRGGAGGWLARVWRRVRGAGVHRRAEVFLLCWIVPSWVVFELIATKLPHYTLPMYPALALLSGRMVMAAATRSAAERWRLHEMGPRAGLGIWCGIGLITAAAVAGGAVFAGEALGVWLLVLAPVWVGAVAALVMACRATHGLRLMRAQTLGMMAAAGLLVVALRGPMTMLVPGGMTPTFAADIAAASGGRSRPIASEYHEDSLIFWTRGKAERINADQREAWLREHPDGVAVVRMESEAVWRERGYEVLRAVPILREGTFAVIVRREADAP